MNKENIKWYLVKCNFQNYEAALFNDIKHCKKFVGSKGLSYQEFHTKQEAIKFAGCKESKIKVRITKHQQQRICLACEKPFRGKTKLCPTCNNKRHGISVGTIVALKSMYPEKDVFSIIEDNPWILYKITRTTTAKERAEIRKEKTSEVKSDTYLNAHYTKTDVSIPDYLKNMFAKDESKELLYLEGTRLNPKVYYVCKRCGKEHCQTYESLRHGRGHNCEALKSSGEAIVEEYLKKQHIQYKTQYDTFQCVNPKTKHIMPYDFELLDYRVIIEVQGEQHQEYSSYFHGSIENFEYQLWKDKYKKSFAEKKGYQVIYIDYLDIRNGRYRLIIENTLKSRM